MGAGGRCGETAELRLAAASIHRGEEPPVSGRGGSGTVFITGCGLGCGFCQNYQISRNGMGRVVSPAGFAGITLALEDAGAENINIVTGTHAAPAIASGLDLARERGLTIPVLWNSSAYENEAVLDLLRDRVDVYLPDLKTLDPQVGARFFRASDYPRSAVAAILRMLSFRGELRWKNTVKAPEDGASPQAASVLARGVIIRHLIIPGCLESTRQVIEWFHHHARGRALLSLMTQYTCCGGEETAPAASPQRYLGREEYERVLEWLTEYEIEEGFYQEPAPGRDWLPDFSRTNPFSSRLSRPIWHWKAGVL
ncbi:MAG: radical SAM protein [Treponema sp.]|nr:radical SAM protein [Treponema sp.]